MSFRPGLTHEPQTPSRVILDEAAAWLVTLEERELSESEQSELAAWRSQSPQHEQAWRAVVRLKTMMSAVPAGIGQRVLGRQRLNRRAALKALAGVAIALPASKLAWDEWPVLSADYRVATGEQRTITLPDGSQLQLNTATAVNVRFSGQTRLVDLVEGEILVTTAPHAATESRPFVVQTRAGRIQALGTRFSVRDTGSGRVHVNVYEHAVAIKPVLANDQTRIGAGEAVDFNRQRTFAPGQLHQSVPPWTQGQIVADNQRLGDFVAELARYRTGILRCDPVVADLRISGVFQLKNTDQALNTIASTLPVRIHRATGYWVTVTEQP